MLYLNNDIIDMYKYQSLFVRMVKKLKLYFYLEVIHFIKLKKIKESL